jgi:hypothetical protein
MQRQVGDKVYVRRWGRFFVGEVTRVTRSGQVYVKRDDSEEELRFMPDGRHYGRDFGNATLDSMAFEKRKAELEHERLARLAVARLAEVHPKERLSWQWGREGLMKELARLRGLLEVAEAAVMAVPSQYENIYPDASPLPARDGRPDGEETRGQRAGG